MALQGSECSSGTMALIWLLLGLAVVGHRVRRQRLLMRLSHKLKGGCCPRLGHAAGKQRLTWAPRAPELQQADKSMDVGAESFAKPQLFRSTGKATTRRTTTIITSTRMLPDSGPRQQEPSWKLFFNRTCTLTRLQKPMKAGTAWEPKLPSCSALRVS